MARKQFGIRFDEALMARVDAEVERVGSTRTAYIEGAVEARLDGPGYTPVVGQEALPAAPSAGREPPPLVRYTPEELEARRQRHRLAFGCELANFQVRDEVDADRMRKLLGEERR